MNQPVTTRRRTFLRMALTSLAGAAGFSVMTRAARAQPQPVTGGRELAIRVPERLEVARTVAPTRRVLTKESSRAAAESIAPTLEQLVAAAGIELPDAERKALTEAFLSRGTITVKPGGAAAAGTLSVEVNSCNWTSKTMGRIRQPIR